MPFGVLSYFLLGILANRCAAQKAFLSDAGWRFPRPGHSAPASGSPVTPIAQRLALHRVETARRAPPCSPKGSTRVGRLLGTASAQVAVRHASQARESDEGFATRITGSSDADILNADAVERGNAVANDLRSCERIDSIYAGFFAPVLGTVRRGDAGPSHGSPTHVQGPPAT